MVGTMKNELATVPDEWDKFQKRKLLLLNSFPWREEVVWLVKCVADAIEEFRKFWSLQKVFFPWEEGHKSKQGNTLKVIDLGSTWKANKKSLHLFRL